MLFLKERVPFNASLVQRAGHPSSFEQSSKSSDRPGFPWLYVDKVLPERHLLWCFELGFDAAACAGDAELRPANETEPPHLRDQCRPMPP
jgi:hypothetical protein